VDPAPPGRPRTHGQGSAGRPAFLLPLPPAGRRAAGVESARWGCLPLSEIGRELLERPAIVGRGGGIYRHRFAVPAAGEAILNMRIVAQGTNWGKPDAEAGTLRIEFEGQYSQHLIVFGGADEVLYQRFLGDIGIGAHEIMFTFSPEGSAPQAQWIRTVSMSVDVITPDDPRHPGVSNCPILYGRAERDSYEMRKSDVPMYAFFRYPKGGPTGREIEFFYIYSHLDQGMDPALRLAQTGCLAPIEWSFRGALDSAGHIARNLAFQGRNHAPHGFAGKFDLRHHPVLQAVGYEGMFHDKQTTPYRMCLPALEMLPDDRPLAWMQNVYPLSYRIAALELQRQAKLEKPGNPKTRNLSDPHDYLFLQFGRSVASDARTAPGIEVLVAVQGHPQPFSSTFGDAKWAKPGTEPFGTAVKLPPGTPIEAISEIRVRAVPQGRAPFQVEVVGPQVAFFLTGPDYQVGPMPPGIPSDRAVTLTAQQPEATVWRAGGA
jgi:hypothetical protein